jgi:hypothetical protein
MVGCSSITTKNTNLFSVNTEQLIWDITSNGTFETYESSDEAKANLLNIYHQIQSRLPSEYFVGMSGMELPTFISEDGFSKC